MTDVWVERKGRLPDNADEFAEGVAVNMVVWICDALENEYGSAPAAEFVRKRYQHLFPERGGPRMTRPDSALHPEYTGECTCDGDVMIELNVASYLAKRWGVPVTDTLELPCSVLMAASRYVQEQERRPIILDKPPGNPRRDNRPMLLNRLAQLAAIGTLAIGMVFLLIDFQWFAVWAVITGAVGFTASWLNRLTPYA